MSDVEFRRATALDAEELAAVYRSAYRENRELGFPAIAGSATADDVSEWIDDHRVLVAEVEDDIVGGVRLEAAERPDTAEPLDASDSPDSSNSEPNCVKLSRFGVHEDRKGAGIGSQLLAHAEETVRDWGYGAIWLTTPGEHPYLADFYRRRGYEKTGPYPLDFRDYDEIVMEKSLR